MRVVRTVVVPALCAVASCQLEPAWSGRAARSIVNGTVDTDPAHDAVVALTDEEGSPFCTGTYVGNQTVVTAAHCFDHGPPAYVYFGVHEIADNEACLAGDDDACYQFVELESYLLHPDWSTASLELGNDIALIDLGEEIDGVTPIPFLAFSAGTELQSADEGAPIRLLGFGVTDSIRQTGEGTRRLAAGVLDRLGPAVFEWEGESVSLTDDQLFTVQPQAGTCQGDSGGPLLIERDGTEFLAAVTSYGDDGCASYGVSVTVDVHEEFIREFYGDDEIPGPGRGGNEDDGAEDGTGDAGGGGCAVSTPRSGAPPLASGLIAVLALPRRGRARRRYSASE